MSAPTGDAPTAPTPTPVTCPACGTPARGDSRFCEACGSRLVPDPPASSDPASSDPASSDPTAPGPARPACTECGGAVAADGYCEQCGAKAPAPRDHLVDTPAAWVGGVCDRGRVHPRNEDSQALAASLEPGRFAVLVVCDGVSSVPRSDEASLAAARAALAVLVAGGPTGSGPVVGDDVARAAAWSGLLDRAARAGDDAVADLTSPTATSSGPAVPHPAAPPTPEGTDADTPSCTFVAAVLDQGVLHTGSVGDSRAYWLPDAGTPMILTTDDSWAAEAIAAGMPRAEAETAPQAHAITRWLGVDSPDVAARATSRPVTGPGWVLVCSDGLWNYCSPPEDLAALVATTAAAVGGDPVDVATELVRWANAQGGRDNITATLARLDAPANR